MFSRSEVVLDEGLKEVSAAADGLWVPLDRVCLGMLGSVGCGVAATAIEGESEGVRRRMVTFVGGRTGTVGEEGGERDEREEGGGQSKRDFGCICRV